MTKRALVALLILTMPLTMVFSEGQKETGKAEKVTVTLWHGLTAADGKYMESLMQQYIDKKNPNIKLEPSAIAWSDLYAKVKTAFLSKTLPTFMVMHVQYVPIYADNAIKSFDDIVAPLNLKDKLIPAFFEMTKYNGKTYYVPMTLVTAHNYFWRQDLIDLGFNPDNPPAKVDEFTQFGRKATRGTGDGRIWGAQLGWGFGGTFQAMLESGGGRFLTPDGSKAAFNNPQGLQVLKTHLDWWYDNQIAPRQEVGSFDDQVKRFVNHKITSWRTGTSVIGHIESVGRKNLSYQKVPYFSQPTADAFYHGVALTRVGSKSQDKAALEILNWMLEPEINADFSAGSGQFPGAKAAYDTQLWKESGWWLQNALPTVVRPVPFIPHRKRDKMQEILTLWLNKVRDKQLTPEEGLTNAEKEINQYLSE